MAVTKKPLSLSATQEILDALEADAQDGKLLANSKSWHLFTLIEESPRVSKRLKTAIQKGRR